MDRYDELDSAIQAIRALVMPIAELDENWKFTEMFDTSEANEGLADLLSDLRADQERIYEAFLHAMEVCIRCAERGET